MAFKLIYCVALGMAVQAFTLPAAFAQPKAPPKSAKPSGPPPTDLGLSGPERQPGRGGLDLGWGKESDEEDEPVDDRLPQEGVERAVGDAEEAKPDDFFNQILEGNSRKEDL